VSATNAQRFGNTCLGGNSRLPLWLANRPGFVQEVCLMFSNRWFRRGFLGLVVLGLCWALSTQPSEGQVKRGKSRAAATKYLMRGVVAANCGALGKLVKAEPTDDKGWDTIACHASILNEASYVLMDDGRCPGKNWADACKTLREGSQKLIDAANAKQLESAQTAFKGMTAACSACHSQYKGK
jgi:hypothetical protein